MATGKMTVVRATGSSRPTTPSLVAADGYARTATMTTAVSSKVFNNPSDIAEATGIVGNAGDVVIIAVDAGDVKLAWAVGEDPDPATTYFTWARAAPWTFYCTENDTRFGLAD